LNSLDMVDSMLEMYIYETSQQLEQLETIILESETANVYPSGTIDEIFRIMHTIKGSSAMLSLANIAELAHHIEDLFDRLRSDNSMVRDHSGMNDLLLECVDFIKVELTKVKNKDSVDGDPRKLVKQIQHFLAKQTESIPFHCYQASVFYQDGCEMENMRALALIRNLKELGGEISHIPEDLMDHESSTTLIREKGLQLNYRTDKSYEEVYEVFMRASFVQDFELREVEEAFEAEDVNERQNTPAIENNPQGNQGMLSVHVHKLDRLMDLVGEMVIAEAMVTQNPDLKGLELENFHNASRLLHKITGELQDIVMSIRMVPIAATFQKMQRIVRDMSKKLNKDIELNIIGEETEVDKNIIDHIADPLMHLVRNAMDHGIESEQDRVSRGKPARGRLTLEAKTSGNEVQIIISDDGKGLIKSQILEKAKENGLLTRHESEMSEKEIYNLIFLPGFSTRDEITEFSGRGVGMDVVTKNLSAVGGSISVESSVHIGTAVTMRIPLTLAIIDGMNIMVGKSSFTIPTMAIRESFRPNEEDIIIDPEGNEMIIVRGQCLPIMRLHDRFNVHTDVKQICDGILITLEEDDKVVCLFVDGLIGQQQVVVKALPEYISSTRSIRGLAGCTLLGNGSISLILDVGGLMNNKVVD
jgi:two-component system, chemotaxis family, sensor kinase CheA